MLTVTKKNREYWDSRAEDHIKAVTALFSDLSPDEIARFHSILGKLLKNSEQVYEDVRKR